MKITIYGWSTDMERLVKETVFPGRWHDFGAGEDSARCASSWTGRFIVEVEEPSRLGVAGLGDWHAAPGHGGSANRHTDVRGSKPQVGSSQEGAPD
jgi:hypothetical protein